MIPYYPLMGIDYTNLGVDTQISYENYGLVTFGQVDFGVPLTWINNDMPYMWNIDISAITINGKSIIGNVGFAEFSFTFPRMMFPLGSEVIRFV
jgi:hypothetical protein